MNGISLNDFYASYASTEGSNLDGGTKSGGSVITTDPTTEHGQGNTSTGRLITYGDADCNNEVLMNDVVLIMQALSNNDAYGVGGTAEKHLSEDGLLNADCYDPGTLLTGMDALAVQRFLLDLTELPEYSGTK